MLPLEYVRISQFVPLLPRRQLVELFLWNPRHEALNPVKHLSRVLRIHGLPIGPANKLLDAQQTVPGKVLAQPVVDLLDYQGAEFFIFALPALGEDLIEEPGR